MKKDTYVFDDRIWKDYCEWSCPYDLDARSKMENDTKLKMVFVGGFTYGRDGVMKLA